MNFGRIIKSLSLRQITTIIGKVISSPVMFYCFVKATIECVQLCDQHFGKAHHKNNKANAYRHALWNMFIVHYCLKRGKDLESAIKWAKDITDWHERAFVNNPLETQMDLHNNKMGRQLIKRMHVKDPAKVNQVAIDQYLMEKLQHAKKLTNNTPLIQVNEEQLVYLEDFNT